MTQDTSPSAHRAGSSPERLFTKDFFYAVFINMIIATAFFTLITGLAVYATEEFRAGETAAGFAASAFVLGALFARFFAGKYANSFGRRRVLITCMFLFTISGLAYLWVDSYAALIALRVVHGISLGFGQTALNAAVFDIIPRTRRGEGAGYYLLANSLPPALGPLTAIQVTSRYGFDVLFVTVTVISAIAFLFACLIRVPEVARPGTPWRDRLRLQPRDVIEPRAFSIALVAMLMGVCFASVMAFLNGYARSENMVDAASIYFVVYSAAMLLTRLVMGRVQDKYGDNAVLYPALIVFIGSLTLLAWAPGLWAFVVAGATAGFGFGALLPALQAIIASTLPTHRISIGVSTFFIMMDTGFGLAPLALGPLAEAWGYRWMYGACAVVVVFTVGVYWWVHGRYRVRQGVAYRHTHRWVNEATGVMSQVPKRRH